ncbi:unnamed protein product [Brachionus calyciflorus]|uniref:3'-5' exonuclease domain-containing protein n=1 Tax=Brachionus calyciflorus TaxID=104777 RepID=A0A813M426_9BILA|nr:unnamed protein product [Brachionus calyciflorus]
MNSLRLTRLITGIPKVYLNLIKTRSTMILINSKYSTQIINKNTHKEEKRKNLFLKRVKKFENLGSMQPIIEKFGILWLNSFEKRLENNQKFTIITNKIRISEDNAAEIEEYLWEEFMNSKVNIYHMHISLIEYFSSNATINQDACLIFLNRTFEAWWKQQLNRIKRNVSKYSCHLMRNCTDNSCLCFIDPLLVEKAFNLALAKMFLLISLNKIYKFEDHFSNLRPHIETYLDGATHYNRIKLVNELKLNDMYRIDYENALIPLMIEDKYNLVEEMIVSNEKTLYAFVDVCNRLCSGNTNFKKIADHYNMKKTQNFSGNKVAKYAINWLRKLKKAHLAHTMYPGIIFQLKLNQLRFLTNARYTQSELTSFNGWTELIIDLIGDNKDLIHQLFMEIINYHKDVLVGMFFAEKYGYEYIHKLPSSAKELFLSNMELIRPQYEIKITQLRESDKYKFYWPVELKNESLEFIDSIDQFKNMLDYFEKNQPEVIGLDCEWKPAFGTEDLIDDEELKIKIQRPDTLQIATRGKVFVVDSRFLVDQLEEVDIDRFGNLVLFSEKIIKLGYDFDQDSKKLFHSFPKFKHVFSEFSDHVINVNQVISDFEKKYPLFTGMDQSKPVKTKGLSKLTECVFGKPLDKSECMSNWQNRPLRNDQIRYASLDAYVLIEIHDFLQKRIKELNIEYDYVSRSSYL